MLFTDFARLELILREKQIVLLHDTLIPADQKLQGVLDLLSHELGKPVKIENPSKEVKSKIDQGWQDNAFNQVSDILEL